jgi:hypothetical protein
MNDLVRYVSAYMFLRARKPYTFFSLPSPTLHRAAAAALRRVLRASSPALLVSLSLFEVFARGIVACESLLAGTKGQHPVHLCFLLGEKASFYTKGACISVNSQRRCYGHVPEQRGLDTTWDYHNES